MDGRGGDGQGLTSKGAAAPASMASQPLLPYARSFLVQFTFDTDPALRRAAGRVEHLQTGRQSRFASISALRACIAMVLGSTTPSSPGGGAPEASSLPAARPRPAKAPGKRGARRGRRAKPPPT